ncbi:adenine-specific DNA-methyltransferase [Butyrivibrio sp. ob235]|uniref:site-specific DNA-methyltransferase n=1 Tax=Butyrivibrio sp. ob235 TaxID=1761780 RepID=UPI0008AB8729|nr:site-specific DNA-methyltransferase [Butyrivibrio sp. ob235]SEM01622.1 adenine-specific DNA-methyltransferase [Butyrivibrio sp. ob235]
MEKMKMETVNGVIQNIDKIAEIFPNCVTEILDEEKSTKDKKCYKRAVNFELLKQMLSDITLEGDEAYEFTWVGKKAAIVEANKPIRKTLRPCIDKSIDWDKTEHIYIEGDNLFALKLLQESYLGAIKLIYIDPPYNTGHDFIYPDSYMMDEDEYDDGTGYFDENNNVNYSRENSTSEGRYHSDWCSIIYSRLLLAKNLLTQDGFIFISIDDNEVSNLRKICDEVFGSTNFRGQITRATGTPTGQGNDKLVSEVDYILIYSKSNECVLNGLPFSEEDEKIYNLEDEYGRYLNRPLRKTGGEDRREDRPSMYYPIYSPDGTEVYPIAPAGYESRWRCAESRYKELVDEHRIDWKNENGTWKVYQKFYLEGRTKQASNLWTGIEGNKKATITVKNIFGKNVFDFPKPIELLKRIIKIATNDGDIIMDFYSGSASTAQAVLEINKECKGNRKYILVQLEEPCKEGTEAKRAGYETICDIGEDRIRKVSNEISNSNDNSIDTGVRIYRVDEGNMNDIYYSADKYSQGMVAAMESNIKADRSDLDLLFGCVLEWGLPLSLPYFSEVLSGVKVHTYNNGDLIACFDENVPEDVVKEIAKRQPLRAVFRDSSFSSSPAKINVGEIFKAITPDTSVKVI